MQEFCVTQHIFPLRITWEHVKWVTYKLWCCRVWLSSHSVCSESDVTNELHLEDLAGRHCDPYKHDGEAGGKTLQEQHSCCDRIKHTETFCIAKTDTTDHFREGRSTFSMSSYDWLFQHTVEIICQFWENVAAQSVNV